MSKAKAHKSHCSCFYRVAEADRLRAALTDVQWLGCREDGEPSCPQCAAQPYQGHDVSCAIGQALATPQEQP